MIQFKPAISIKNLLIANPVGYRNTNFVEAKELHAELSLLKLLQKQIHINKIIISQASIMLEQNSFGNRNLDVIIKKLTKNPAPINFIAKSKEANQIKDKGGFLWKPNVDSIVLDKFSIKESKIKLISYERGGQFEVFNIDHINFNSQNFSTNKASGFDIEFAVLDIPFPVLNYRGSIGPVFAESIATQGELELAFKLRDIPKESREKYFGSLIMEPSPDDELRLEAKLSGDLLKQIFGEGFLRLNEIHSGKNKEHQLKLNGLIPIKLSISNLMSNPRINFLTEKTKLQINEGSFIELNSKILSTSIRTSIETQGSIKGFDINEFLSAYTEYENELYGQFAIPQFQVKLNGSDADEMLTSMEGFGSIIISNGNLAILEKVYKLKGLLANYAETKTKLHHEDLSKFTSIESNFRIENRKLKNDSIQITSPVLTFYGFGEYGFDNQLNYHMMTQEIPIHVSGTAAKPKLDLDDRQFTINEVQKQLQPLADKLFNQFLPKKKEPGI